MSLKYRYLLCIFTFNYQILTSQIIINEIFATNNSYEIIKPQYNYLNWIEFFNSGNTSVSVTGYYLSDDSTNLKKWTFPNASLASKGFYIVYADKTNTGNHCNFSLDAEGGNLYLSDKKGKLITKFHYPRQVHNVSYGRYPDGSTMLGYCIKPTRAAINSNEIAHEFSNDPAINLPGGFYKNSVTIEFNNLPSGKCLRFTTNGTEPIDTSTLYENPITLTTTTVIRARIFEKGKVPSNIVSATFFINNRNISLPVISIITDPKNISDNMIGIFVKGKNGIIGNGSSVPVNWNQDWERCVNFEFFENNKRQIVNQLSGIKISGNWTRLNAQKSFSIYARGRYGKTKFTYKFFPDLDVDKFDALYFRNSGNDWNNTMFRDAVSQHMVDGEMDIDHQKTRHVAIYMNGAYYGMLVLYQKSGGPLIENNYGLDESNFEMVESNSNPIVGSDAGYASLLNYIRYNDLSNNQVYNYVKSQMDINNYIDYMITEIYICNTDWPGNNIRFWRQINPVQTKWRWILFDTDYGLWGNYGYDFNSMAFAIDSTNYNNWPNPEWSTFLFRTLLRNNEFKEQFINQFFVRINTTFNPQRVIIIIDSLRNSIAKEIPYQFRKWGHNPNNWDGNVEKLREFVRLRPQYMRDFLRQTFNLGEELQISVNSNIAGAGKIILNDVQSPDTVLRTTLTREMKYNLKTMPLPGFKFVKLKAYQKTYYSPTLISKNSNWKYFDKGYEPASDWKDKNFDDTGWESGPGELGYGDNDEATKVSFGPDTNNKYITTYFRYSFDYDSIPLTNLKISILRDDGAVVYLNNNEVFRSNMPSGDINYYTLATGATDEATYYEFSIDPSYIVTGKNVVAVEIHQTSAESSDISFDMSMYGSVSGEIYPHEYYVQEITDTIKSNMLFTAYFTENEIKNEIIINEISPLNTTLKDEFGDTDHWIEVVNTSNDTIDLAGLYFTDSLMNKLKYQIPNSSPGSTKIAPNEHKILWADGEPYEGPLHLNFKLNMNGEDLAISNPVGFKIDVLDSVKYDAVYGKQTFGRYPDISGKFKAISPATPAKVNQNIADNIHSLSSTDPIVKYVDEKLIISADNNNFTHFGIYDMMGRIKYKNILKGNYSTYADLSLSNGTYVICIEGNKIFNKKFVVIR